MKNSQGFSLIELMIVIAIMNILASIAIPNYMTYKSKANFSACVTSLRNLEMAELMHYLDNDTYTNDGDDLAVWIRTPTQTEEGLNEIMSGSCEDWKASSAITATSETYTITGQPKGKYKCTITIKEDGSVAPKNFSECKKLSEES